MPERDRQKPLAAGNFDEDVVLVEAGPEGGEEREVEIVKGVKMVFCWIPAGKATLAARRGRRDEARMRRNTSIRQRAFGWASMR